MTDVLVKALPNGPYLVDGHVEVVDRAGQEVDSPHSSIYLCRCGRSQSKPFCDGSHARTGWDEDTCPTP